MSDCDHLDFAAEVAVHRVCDGGSVRNFIADVSVKCVACGLPFQFVGPEVGLSWTHPTVDIPHTTLHCPVVPGDNPAPLSSVIRFEVGSRSFE